MALAALFIILGSAGIATATTAVDDRSRTSQPSTAPADREAFLAHPRETRFGLVHIGASDKPTLPLLVAVGDSVAQTGERETEVTADGQTRQVAIVCPLSQEEMAELIRRTFDARLFGDTFAWDKGGGDEFHRYLLTIRVGVGGGPEGQRESKRSAEITGAGAVTFRTILSQVIRPDNVAARHALGMR